MDDVLSSRYIREGVTVWIVGCWMKPHKRPCHPPARSNWFNEVLDKFQSAVSPCPDHSLATAQIDEVEVWAYKSFPAVCRCGDHQAYCVHTDSSLRSCFFVGYA